MKDLHVSCKTLQEATVKFSVQQIYSVTKFLYCIFIRAYRFFQCLYLFNEAEHELVKTLILRILYSYLF